MKLLDDTHDGIHLVDTQVTMDLLHGLARVPHGVERFLVDVGGFDRVDLVLEHGDLARCLLKGVLVRLLSFQCCSGSCAQTPVSVCPSR